MVSRVVRVALSALLAAQLSHAQSASFSNVTLTTTPSSTPTETRAECCVLVPMTVGLNYWWNETLTATVATVITKVYQYNNTRITSTTTVSNATAVDDVTVPFGIIPGTFLYSRTIVGTNTSAVFPNTVIASPTPFVEVIHIGYLPGFETTDSSGQPSCSETTYTSFDLATGYAYVETPPVVRSSNEYANAPGTDLIDFWISATPTITKDIPNIRSCSVPSGSGEPSVHVPVMTLTSHETTTINVDGGGPQPPASSSSNSPPTSTTDPLPVSNPPSTSTSSSKPTSTPIPTSTSGPQPTSNNPPPASTSTGGTNPPANTQQPGSGPTTATGGSNPQQSGTTANNNPNPNPQPTLPIALTPAPTSSGSPPAVVLPNGGTLSSGTITTLSGHTISLAPGAPSTVIGGSTVPGAPVVVVDGTTATLGAASGTPAAVLSATLGSGASATVVSFGAASTSGGGLVLPNGQTLAPGSTTTYLGETLVLTTGAGGSTVLQVVDSSTTQMVAVPTAAGSVSVYGSGSGTGGGSPATKTSGAPPEEYTGAAERMVARNVLGLAALGAVVVLGA